MDGMDGMGGMGVPNQVNSQSVRYGTSGGHEMCMAPWRLFFSALHGSRIAAGKTHPRARSGYVAKKIPLLVTATIILRGPACRPGGPDQRA